MLIENLNRTIDVWITALEPYHFHQLCAKPAPNNWSVGQVYMHLIEHTNFYLQQIHICVTTNDYANEEASVNAKEMFLNNSLPDVIINGPASNAYTPQPASKEHLRGNLMLLKQEVNKIGTVMSQNVFQGKTKHPGLHYFSANEWLQFADMHFRHHLRQKERIDEFLNNNKMD